MNLIQSTILTSLPVGRKKTPSGWTSFNAPCCVHNGESQDKKKAWWNHDHSGWHTVLSLFQLWIQSIICDWAKTVGKNATTNELVRHSR